MHEREPTADESGFFTRLSLVVPGLDDWYHRDPDGSPWMCVSHDVIDERAGGIVRTWRLDFDGRHIAAGESPAHLNWDGGVRAEEAGIDTSPPVGLLADVDESSAAAELAAGWFRDRIPQRAASGPDS